MKCKSLIPLFALTSILVPVPTIEITDTDLPPEIGEPYTPNCFGSVPPDLEGSVTVSWITPNGDVVDTITSDDNASLPLSFVPFEEGDVGQYICQVRVTSRFLNGPVGTGMSVTLALENTVVPPTTGPIGTDPSTTTALPPLTTGPIGTDPSTTTASPPLTTGPIGTDPSTTTASPPLTTMPAGKLITLLIFIHYHDSRHGDFFFWGVSVYAHQCMN